MIKYLKKIGRGYVWLFTVVVVGAVGILSFRSFIEDVNETAEYIVSFVLSAIITGICWKILNIKNVKEIISIMFAFVILTIISMSTIGKVYNPASNPFYYLFFIMAFVLIPMGINIRVTGNKELKKEKLIEWYRAVYAFIIFYYLIGIMVTKL